MLYGLQDATLVQDMLGGFCLCSKSEYSVWLFFLCRLFIVRDAKTIFIYHIKEADGPRGQVDQPNQAAGPVKLMSDK